MESHLLTTSESAKRLGISRATLYDWLRQSDAGEFIIRGQPLTISYYQGGRRGQGRILMNSQEVQRVLNHMRAQPRSTPARRPAKPTSTLRHITRLGRPDD